MLLLPKHFDTNEIYILFVSILLLTLLIALPKKFTKAESLLYFLVNFSLAVVIDHILAGNPLNAYDIMDNPKFEVMDLYIYAFVYAPSGYLFLYFYTIFATTKMKKILYLAFSIIATVFLEWMSVKFNVFTYLNWSLVYSATTYFFLYGMNIAFMNFFKKRLPK